ncbi:AIPR family protein [Caballeronia sordidicola]|uniref:AIPR family protein n=1 Tax=Caballeronia sordidicola TaxID=196367 RepID=UPI0004CFEFB8|nr:AIPR family protein [Caballeronia sordidicola]
MKPDLSYPAILEIIAPYKSNKRTESAAFLAWYLANYYRLDNLEAIDCICDQPGDKGVDGIYVNEGAGTIDIFQSKISQKANSSIGDTQLKEFHGTLAQFQSVESLQNLINSAGDVQVASLIKRLDLLKKIEDYDVRGVFVANLDIDHNGSAYLKTATIKFVGRSEMEETYISDQKEQMHTGEAEFDIFGVTVSDYAVDGETKAAIGPVLASDLVKLGGIADQSLFSANVRASLGNTKVNKDIANSIRNPALHKAFPLFHNGITVLAKSVAHDDKKLTIKDYYVVNGCQSLNALHLNREFISGDLRVLTKFIQVKVDSDLSELITTYSNNQNGVKARDFKSNHPIQTRLQKEFDKFYATDYSYEVKRGEPQAEDTISISNEDAGLLLIAFDLEEPWTTHRKYQIFEDRYAEIFGRPDVTADRIVLLHEIAEVLREKLPELKNQLIGKYVLTTFDMLLAVRRILEQDLVGKEMISTPKKFARSPEMRQRFRKMMESIISALVIDLDVETQDLADDFDYRGKLRDREYVVGLVNALVASYRKDVMRKKTPSIGEAWEEAAK